MKKSFIAAAVLILTAGASAANATLPVNNPVTASVSDLRQTPPPVVVNSFRAIFGNVPVRQWKLRSNNQWRAHFTRNGIAWEATFTSTGALVKSEPA